MDGGAPTRHGRRVWQCNPALGHKDEVSWADENTENTGANGHSCGGNTINQTLKEKLPKKS
jgi:hypothetical protein